VRSGYLLCRLSVKVDLLGVCLDNASDELLYLGRNDVHIFDIELTYLIFAYINNTGIFVGVIQVIRENNVSGLFLNEAEHHRRICLLQK
jgi:hypothetical protein